MRKANVICWIACLVLCSETAFAADLPPILHCTVIGAGGCDGDVCVGGGRADPSIKLTVFRSTHKLVLNGISGTIDEGSGDPTQVLGTTLDGRGASLHSTDIG